LNAVLPTDVWVATAAVSLLLIAVEMLLMDYIRQACGVNENRWLDHLEMRQRGTIEKHWKEAVKRNLAIDRLSCASFGQEIRAAWNEAFDERVAVVAQFLADRQWHSNEP